MLDSISLQLPNDNFGTIKPCSHITRVLSTKAKDTVFATYKQAVAISKPLSKENVYRNKKDGSIIPFQTLVDKKSKSIQCTDCGLHQDNFICLQCPHVGCNNHSHSHYKLHLHLFAIDSSNGLLYCFMCGNYVNHPSLENIRLGKDYQDEITNGYHSNYSNPSKFATSGLKGFVNLGATCFMSSILQTFIHNPIIKHYFFNNDLHYLNCEKKLNYIKNNYTDESNACITCSIDQIFEDFYTDSTHNGYGMSNLLITAWYKKKSFSGFQEQDAHEFWQTLLDEFHTDYERVTKNLDISSSKDCQCITHTTFAGELQSSITCQSCKSITKTIDPVLDLSLEIKNKKHHQQTSSKSLTIYDCLDLFTSVEKLDVVYSCQHCGDKTKATKSLKFKTLPPVLSIQLKRFEHNLISDQFSKIDTPVKIPLFLNMTKYCEQSKLPNNDEIDSSKIYELFAAVVHIGSVHTGHYIVMTKSGTGQWFKFDDSIVTMITQEDVINSNAYLLFYITHKI